MQQNRFCRFCLKWFEKLSTFSGTNVPFFGAKLWRETFCRKFLGGNEIGDRGRHQAILGRIQDIFGLSVLQLQRLTSVVTTLCRDLSKISQRMAGWCPCYGLSTHSRAVVRIAFFFLFHAPFVGICDWRFVLVWFGGRAAGNFARKGCGFESARSFFSLVRKRRCDKGGVEGSEGVPRGKPT